MALPAEDTAARLTRQLAGAERNIRSALTDAIAAAVGTHTLAELAALIEAGQFDEALEAAAAAGAIRVSEGAVAAVVAAGQARTKFLEGALEVVIGFDQTNERAAQVLRTERFRLIQNFTAEQRRATRAALVEGTERGLNPRDQARLFRQSIGLTERQQTAVRKYRELLERGSLEALNRRLRDKRFDSTIRRAAREGVVLTPQQIDRMVERYAEKTRKYRAELIARTEALRAVHIGGDEAMAQAIDEGHLAPEQVVRKWITASDERVRSSHQHLHGQERGMGETWDGAIGTLRYPGDPLAPASETIHCRCTLATRIISI